MFYILFFCTFLFSEDHTSSNLIKNEAILSDISLLSEDKVLDLLDNKIDINPNYSKFTKEINNFKIESGYTDKMNSFKLLPDNNYFIVSKKNNDKFIKLGKISFPNYEKSKSIKFKDSAIALEGKVFISIFRYDNNKDKLYVWRKTDKENEYRRFFLGNLNYASISADGNSVIAFNQKSHKLYIWNFDNKLNKYIKKIKKIIGFNVNKVSLGLNNNGSIAFLVSNEKSESEYSLPIFIFKINDDKILTLKRFEIPANKALGDISYSGNQFVFSYQLINSYNNKYEKESRHLILFEIKDLNKPPIIKAFFEIDKNFEQLRLKFDGKYVIIGDKLNYETYLLEPLIEETEIKNHLKKIDEYYFLY